MRKWTRKWNLKFEQNRKKTVYICVPWFCNSHIPGRDGAWREWSGIWLAHLLRKSIESLSMDGHRKTKHDTWAIMANFIGKLRKRTKYTSRRNDFWWKEKELLSEYNKEDGLGDVKANNHRLLRRALIIY